MSDVLHKILNLRPTNAAMRLGPSWLPVLNPRDLQRALEGRNTALLTAPIYSRAAIPGLLGAARHLDAVIGLGVPFPLGERDRPDAFVDELLRSCEEIPHKRPVFLQAGPFRIRSSEDRALETYTAQIFRYLEAGSSLLSLDASSLELNAAARVYAALGQAAAERELSVEVAALRDQSGGTLVSDSGRMLQTLRAFGVGPLYLRADISGLIYDNQLRAERVRELVEVAREHEASLCLEDTVGVELELIPLCVAEGCRKWDATETFARKTAPALPKGATEALTTRASEVQRPWTELLGALSEGLAYPEDGARIRVEAMAYEEAATLLRTLSAGGTASASTKFLAEHPAY